MMDKNAVILLTNFFQTQMFLKICDGNRLSGSQKATSLTGSLPSSPLSQREEFLDQERTPSQRLPGTQRSSIPYILRQKIRHQDHYK